MIASAQNSTSNDTESTDQSTEPNSTAVVKSTTVQAAATTKVVCLNGTCNGSDESCVKNISGTCPFKGSCTKQVQTTGQKTKVTVGCGASACPKTTTTPSLTTTYTCCETALCNKYEPPKSAAVSFRSNMFYFVSIVILAFVL
ncbi:uncharacterized protein LOC128548439 [Mercenaria mercenaria]|uniref:uncharacterized protein LOC128548439 n=1 Tax=Mercenaria mercenaria TaxID=6596 RepID=UPI00234E743A|nr:uncharacterized protein LOC128548439 [Mercenaria mercenaria]